jgi:hypothetical protein
VLWLVFSCLSYKSSSFFISIFETPRDSKLNRTKNIFILHLTFKYPNTNKKFKHYYFETFACAKKKKILIHLFLPLLHNCCHYDHISSPPSFLCRPTTPKGPTELLQVPITASDAHLPIDWTLDINIRKTNLSINQKSGTIDFESERPAVRWEYISSAFDFKKNYRRILFYFCEER